MQSIAAAYWSCYTDALVTLMYYLGVCMTRVGQRIVLDGRHLVNTTEHFVLGSMRLSLLLL